MIADHIVAFRPAKSSLFALRTTAIALSCFALLAGSTVFADPFDQAHSQLERASFLPITSRLLADDLIALRRAVERADVELRGRGQVGQDWRRYFEMDELLLKMAAVPDEHTLEKLRLRLSANYAGLEIPVLLELRRALVRYEQARELAERSSLADEFASARTELLAALAEYRRLPDTDAWRRLAQAQGELSRLRQAPQALALLRKQSLPNLLVGISQPVAAVYVNRVFDQPTPVADVILGTTITGWGRTQGTTNVRFQQQTGETFLELVAQASITSETVGSNGPVRVYSDASTTLHAVKKILLSESGLAGMTASAGGCTDSSPRCIVADAGGPVRNRIAERVAGRKLRKNEASAERIASQRAAEQFAQELDARANSELVSLNDSFREKIRNPLLRKDQFPQVAFTAEGKQLRVAIQQADANQLAAPAAPPELTTASELSLRVHESFFGNYFEGMHGGETLSQREMEIWLAGFLSDSSVVQTDRRDDLSIRLAKVEPLRVRIDNNLLSVRIHGEDFDVGRRDFPPMIITLRYALEKTDAGGLRLTMQGNPEYLPPRRLREEGPEKLTLRESALARVLTDRLAEHRVIERESISLPGKGKALGTLRVQEFWGKTGWLGLSCGRSPGP